MNRSIKKDIFISYKNDGEGKSFAARLCSDLEKIGYEVYFNPKEQHAGNFPDRLRNAVGSCKDFILIVTQSCLDQLMRYDKVDWVREELLTAHRCNKNIIPLLMDGVAMPKDKDEMPEELRFLPDKDAVDLFEPYDISPFAKLINWMKSTPNHEEKNKYTYQSNSNYDVDEDYLEALALAESGDEKAMYDVATFCMYNLGEQDVEKAYFWYNELLKSDNDELKAHALNRLAGMYFAGTIPGEGQSFLKAFEFREKAAEFSETAAKENAAMRRIGSGCPFNYKEIEDGFNNLKKVDSVSIMEQAEFYLSYGRFAEAIDLLKKIQNIMPEASYQLGKLYKLGVQTTPPMPDCFRAESYFIRALSKGYFLAAYELGMLYYNPPMGDFDGNFELAVNNFKIAADEGVAEAQYKLGWMYRYGLGCETNFSESIKYHEMAAKQGHVGSCTQLSYLYQSKGNINYEKAYKYSKLAADSGYAHGAFVCGNFLFFGRGCTANETEAVKYYNYAYEHGSFEAKIMMDRMRKRN